MPSSTFVGPAAHTAALTVNVSVTETEDPGMLVLPAPTSFELTPDGAFTCQMFAVPTDDDTVDEPNSSVTLTLLPGTGYDFGPTSERAGTVSVADNDDAGDPPPPPALPTITIAGNIGDGPRRRRQCHL